ncbi:MAG: pyridoxamine 5'-phosphate oxidase family protein [Lysobacteraceae bacterium]|nr:MAG: pyridoxamine 5'-phosphate oxidase family protein [Xanthomonadaceae bacterium]
MTTPPPRDGRHRVERTKARARYDRASVHAVLDAGMLAHVGFCVDGQPFVIPMLYARDGDSVLLHGSVASRLMRGLGEGIAACITVTHVDGLVLARSHFDHSVNYRSVVAFGRARAIDDPGAKAAALARFVDAMLPGRSTESRAADASELGATSVLLFEIEDASAKVREGGAKENAADLAVPAWAGVVPMRNVFGTPLPEADLVDGIELPRSVRDLFARNGASA